jgi:serine/threonine protein kinase
MSFCINPNCKQSNPNDQRYCENCGLEVLLLGRYQVVSLLSEKGGFADTYEVRHHGTARVLKVLKDSNPKAIELFKREYEVLNQSNHPGIPKTEEYFEITPRNSSQPLQCLVMEKITGIDLEEHIRQRGNPIDERCAIEWLDQIAHILQFIHAKNLLHRDIKPSHIILQPDGQLALIDFGAVGRFDNSQPLVSPTCIYTPGYAAPEQVTGRSVPESDFFALGRTFVYLLTGRPITEMFDANGEWHSHAIHFSDWLVQLIDRMMHRQVQERPNNATEIIDCIAENRSASQSYSSFHNKSISPTIDLIEPISQVSATARANTNGGAVGLISPVPVMQQIVELFVNNTRSISDAQDPDRPQRKKGAIILGAIAGLALLGVGVQMNKPGSNNPVTTNPKGDDSQPTGAADRCKTQELDKTSGNTYGAIEIGSKGVKVAVIQKLDTPNDAGFRHKALEHRIKPRNVNAINGKNKDDTIKAIEEIVTKMGTDIHIPCEKIVIYGSSGFDSKAPSPYKKELIAGIETATGRKVDLISPADEAMYVFEGIVPDWWRDKVISVDIGSGNTKGAFLKTDNKTLETYVVPVGTADFSREIKKNSPKSDMKKFIETAKEQKNSVVIPGIKKVIDPKSAVFKPDRRIYLAGGISWAMTTLINPCAKEQNIFRDKEERVSSYTKLQVIDIDLFYNNATGDRKTLFNPDLRACTTEQKKKAQEDISKIQESIISADGKKGVFSEEDIIAGAEILRAVSQELKFSEKDNILFARNALDALPIGYLIHRLEKSKS